MTQAGRDFENTEDALGDLHQKVEQVQAAMARVRGRAYGAGNAVTVEVGPVGSLEQLKLTPQAMRMDPYRLAETIKDCYRRAAEDARTGARAALGELANEPAVRDADAFVREFLRLTDRPGRGP